MELVADDFLTRLSGWVRRRVPSSADADDVVQTVLLRYIETREKRELASPHAWLRAAARHAIADLHRARSRNRAHSGNGSGADEPESVDAARDAKADDDGEQGDRAEAAACLAPLLATLPTDEQRLLTRVDVEGESQTALARELGLSKSGLKSRVQRARAKLREALLARCIVERDRSGRPFGGASCRNDTAARDCGCTPSSPAQALS
ncbi:MAG: sigma-70 family RNA polymerase sigma factor [Planctomycetes bacterium]|nr:sigma-70 family RNA polymerase sigma factor [Planctomycetota bacterium]